MIRETLLSIALLLSVAPAAKAGSEITVPVQESECSGGVTITVNDRDLFHNGFRMLGAIRNDTACPLSGVVVHYLYQVGPQETVLAKGSKSLVSTNNEPLMPGEETTFQAISPRWSSSRSQDEPVLNFAVSVASDR